LLVRHHAFCTLHYIYFVVEKHYGSFLGGIPSQSVADRTSSWTWPCQAVTMNSIQLHSAAAAGSHGHCRWCGWQQSRLLSATVSSIGACKCMCTHPGLAPPLNGRQISASKTFSSPPQLLFTVVSAAPGRLIAVQCSSSSGPVYPMATGCPWGGGGNVSALVSALSHGPCTMIEQPVDLGSFVSYSSC